MLAFLSLCRNSSLTIQLLPSFPCCIRSFPLASSRTVLILHSFHCFYITMPYVCSICIFSFSWNTFTTAPTVTPQCEPLTLLASHTASTKLLPHMNIHVLFKFLCCRIHNHNQSIDDNTPRCMQQCNQTINNHLKRNVRCDPMQGAMKHWAQCCQWWGQDSRTNVPATRDVVSNSKTLSQCTLPAHAPKSFSYSEQTHHPWTAPSKHVSEQVVPATMGS